MRRLITFLLAAIALAWAPGAFAKVTASFHSFNGSVLFGRYPHTFVVLEGTEDATGRRVKENYGFSAKTASPAVLAGPVEHVIYVEKDKWIGKTNRHFSVELTDAQYRAIKREVEEWRSQPGKFYDLDKNNCIHFVGAIARIAGVKVDYPAAMIRKPKAWLNHVVAINPQVRGKRF